jgi:hypothetical protein
MRNAALLEFSRQNYLSDGHAHVLTRARPFFDALISDLSALGDGATVAQRREPFRRCVEALNGMGDDIETVERECFCEALYALGDIVDLERKSQFVDDWRGDW